MPWEIVQEIDTHTRTLLEEDMTHTPHTLSHSTQLYLTSDKLLIKCSVLPLISIPSPFPLSLHHT